MTDLLAAEVTEPVPTSELASRTSLLRKVLRRPLGTLALVWLVLIVVVALFAPLLAPYSATDGDLTKINMGPSSAHWLGTDQLGRDILSRLMYGSLSSVEGVVIAVLVFLLVGLPLGLVAGYRGGWIDSVISRITDVLLSLPGMILLLVVLSVFGRNQAAAMIALGVLGAPTLIRVTRAVTLSVREDLYVGAARVFGLRDSTIVARHVLPRVRSAVVVQAALFAGAALLTQSGLAFLGFGPQPPAPSWGGMIADASSVITIEPSQIIAPGLVIAMSILAFGLLGNAIRDAVSESWSTSQADLLRRTPRRGGEANAHRNVVPLEQSTRTPLLCVRDLRISVVSGGDRQVIVRSVNLDILPGETVGLVGESGCGKTLTSLGLIGALPPGARRDSGHVMLAGQDLGALSSAELDKVRGRRIGYVSQQPSRALDPMLSVGNQLVEAVRANCRNSRTEARARAHELLGLVKLPNPEDVFGKYPHQLSGGMAQRVCIALALAGKPELLVADEPTTALDVTTQSDILALIRDLGRALNMATLLITHDWGVVNELCDRAVVMYAGQVVEMGPVEKLYLTPRHPYTAALLGSNPHIAVGLRSASKEPEVIPLLPSIPGDVPPPKTWGNGCTFAPRCNLASKECVAAPIPLEPVGSAQEARCLHTDQVRMAAGVAG
jgi:peptide/nickel transport system permease protein